MKGRLKGWKEGRKKSVKSGEEKKVIKEGLKER